MSGDKRKQARSATNFLLVLVRPIASLTAGFFIWISMKRHLTAYLIVLLIYFIPPMISSPSGWLYFVSISAWSWISVILYLTFIRLRCATILCVIEVLISLCATIALCEYNRLAINWHAYSNLESIIDFFIILELLVITASLIGTKIGLLGCIRCYKRIRPHNSGGPNCF